MTANDSDDPAERTVFSVLSYLLTRYPEAVVGAFAEDGILIAVPDHPDLAGRTTIPVPAERANMLALIVPGDRMATVHAWERALSEGTADTTVHLLDAPDEPVNLVFLDTRTRYGVRLGILAPRQDDGDRVDDEAQVQVGAANLRPRTGTMTKGLRGTITDLDDRTARMLGFTPEEMVGRRSLDFIHPDDHERAISSFLEMYSTQLPVRVRVRHRNAQDEWLWLEVEHSYHPAEDPEDTMVLARLTDVSDEMAVHAELDRRVKLFHRLAESLPACLFQIQTDGRVVYANARLEHIFGVKDAQCLDDLLVHVTQGDRGALTNAFRSCLVDGIDQQLEVTVLVSAPARPDTPEQRHCAFTLAALSDQEGEPGAIVTVTDVTQASIMREKLRQRATYDALTGCYNRASTMSFLADFVAAGDSLVVLFIDLDGFKPINDRLGHAAGDRLLVHAAAELQSVIRGDDLVGRIGGDEFLVIARGINDRAGATELAVRVRDRLFTDIPTTTGQLIPLRASIGGALSQPGLGPEDLVAHADQAMYRCKQQGDGAPVLHDPGVQACRTSC